MKSWRSEALCAGVDPELFYPGDKNPGTEAKAVCNLCPVKEPCLIFALDNYEDGVWGGTNQRDRSQIRQRTRGNK